MATATSRRMPPTMYWPSGLCCKCYPDNPPRYYLHNVGYFSVLYSGNYAILPRHRSSGAFNAILSDRDIKWIEWGRQIGDRKPLLFSFDFFSCPCG